MPLVRPPARARLCAAVVAALAAFAAAPASARGDIPPDPDSVDAHCTQNEQCPSGVYCPWASGRGEAAEPGAEPVGEACRNAARAKGLERRCGQGNPRGGEELFCPKGETGTWSPPLCSVGAVGAPATSAWLAAVALAGAALLAIRRRGW